MHTFTSVVRRCTSLSQRGRYVSVRVVRPLSTRSMHQDSPRVLSIQSHVVHGHAGNKSAVFPLQLLGFDVDPINSVQFSNHTGYPTFKGKVMNGQELWELIEGLQANDLLEYTHLLTGYIASVSFLETVVKVVKTLRDKNPDLVYICDPVMGDDERLYVSEDLVPAYRDQMVPLATVLTPNQYEAGLLTDTKIDSKASAVAACQALHQRGVATVVITSIRLAELKGELLLVASTQAKQKAGCPTRIQVNIPMLDAYFTGTGKP
ncbi:hypothetical protein ABBQ38_002883 [Trebouxia sp. C0009 RCD-2024]